MVLDSLGSSSVDGYPTREINRTKTCTVHIAVMGNNISL
jgi:hypothetical protein